MVESLNISVACAVTIYEAYRQRCAQGMYDQPMLNKQSMDELRNEWYEKKRGIGLLESKD
jgi:tRNA (guanosine-2'-O-)-methyltransferase